MAKYAGADADAEMDRLRAEVARLTQERDAARVQLEQWAHEHGVEECIAVADITSERDALRACVTQLAQALELYGDHRSECAYDAQTATGCDCGYSAALAAAEKLGT